jgi:protein-disulfide isomerase
MKTLISPVFAVWLLVSVPMIAQNVDKNSGAVRPTNGITQQQANAILDELRAIHQLLANQQGKSAPVPAAKQTVPKVEMSIANGWYSLGRSDAPVTMVEFSDYQCPFCRRFQTDTFGDLKKNYIDTGKVRFISRDFPLEFHANALKAAEAVRCAGEQGKYWEMRDLLIANSKDLTADAIRHYANTLALEPASFVQCVESEKHKAEIEKDMADAASLQISGTPTFVVGRESADVLKGVMLVGAQPYSTFDSIIQEEMKTTP